MRKARRVTVKQLLLYSLKYCNCGPTVKSLGVVDYEFTSECLNLKQLKPIVTFVMRYLTAMEMSVTRLLVNSNSENIIFTAIMQYYILMRFNDQMGFVKTCLVYDS
jgi:hypothetical protein